MEPAKKISTPSFADALASSKTAPGPAAKKSKVPPMPISDGQKTLVDDWRDADTNVKQAEAWRAAAADALIPLVREYQDREGYAGRYSKSYSLTGNRHKITVSRKCQFSINAEDEAKLREILGDAFDYCIKKTPTVKLRAEVFTDEALQARLMELVGDDFPKFFEATFALSAAENLDAQVYNAVPVEELDQFRLFARQYNATIK